MSEEETQKQEGTEDEVQLAATVEKAAIKVDLSAQNILVIRFGLIILNGVVSALAGLAPQSKTLQSIVEALQKIQDDLNIFVGNA